MNKRSRAYQDGYRDGLAQDLDGYASREAVEADTEGWDEGTINAVGASECARGWGVRADGGPRWLAACRNYNAGCYAGVTADQEYRTGLPPRDGFVVTDSGVVQLL